MKTESMKVEDHSGVTVPMTRHPTLFLLTLTDFELMPENCVGSLPDTARRCFGEIGGPGSGWPASTGDMGRSGMIGQPPFARRPPSAIDWFQARRDEPVLLSVARASNDKQLVEGATAGCDEMLMVSDPDLHSTFREPDTSWAKRVASGPTRRMRWRTAGPCDRRRTARTSSGPPQHDLIPSRAVLP
jgi:hypothetical protein